MMGRVIAAGLAFMLASGSALACEVEAWRWYHTPSMEVLSLEGATTCRSGELHLRVYEGEGEGRKFLGIDRAYIEGNTFSADIMAIKSAPKTVTIEYSIQGD